MVLCMVSWPMAYRAPAKKLYIDIEVKHPTNNWIVARRVVVDRNTTELDIGGEKRSGPMTETR